MLARTGKATFLTEKYGGQSLDTGHEVSKIKQYQAEHM